MGVELKGLKVQFKLFLLVYLRLELWFQQVD